MQTLYNRLNGGASAGVAVASVKKAPAAGHRLRSGGSNTAGDGYDDAAALAFLIAAVVDVTIGGGTSTEPPLLTAPAGSAGSSSNDGKCPPYLCWGHRYSLVMLFRY